MLNSDNESVKLTAAKKLSPSGFLQPPAAKKLCTKSTRCDDKPNLVKSDHNRVNASRPIARAAPSIPLDLKPNPPVKSLKQKLIELHQEESLKGSSSFRPLNFATNLLDKLIKREPARYNRLVLNLYDIDKGYSLGFNINESSDTNNNSLKSDSTSTVASNAASLNAVETDLLPYDDTELLFYVNSGEIPPILIDLIDRLNVNLFYDGCIIGEIRDYRRRPAHPETHHVLLQSSTQTLVADLNSICNSGQYIWTQEDKYSLESQLLVATQPALCLDPSPRVAIARSHALSQSSRAFTADRRLKRFALRYSEASRRRAISRFHEYDLPYPFRILKMKRLNQSQTGISSSAFSSSNNHQNPVVSRISGLLANAFNSTQVTRTNRPVPELPAHDSLLVKKLTKIPTPDKSPLKLNTDPSTIAVEEVILEATDKLSKNNYSRLLIKRRASDGLYFCELYLKSDQTCDDVFRLGHASDVEKYVQQYVKIFTEEGRKAVTIKHNLLEKTLNPDGSSNSALKKPANSSLSLSGTTFQSLFPTGTHFEFKDKQLQSYQAFLTAQQRAQLQQQQQQSQPPQQTDLPKRDVNKLDKPVNGSTNSECVNGVNSSVNGAVVATQRVYANIQPAKPNNQAEINIAPKPAVRTKIVKPHSSDATTTPIPPLMSLNLANTQDQHTNQLVQPVSNNQPNYIQIYVPKLVTGANAVVNSNRGSLTPVSKRGAASGPATSPAARKRAQSTAATSPSQPINTTVNIAPRFGPTHPTKIVNTVNLNLLRKDSPAPTVINSIGSNRGTAPVILTINSEAMSTANLNGASASNGSPIKTFHYTPISQKTSTPVKILNEIRLNNDSTSTSKGTTFLVASTSNVIPSGLLPSSDHNQLANSLHIDTGGTNSQLIKNGADNNIR